jgi:hypothetical protein
MSTFASPSRRRADPLLGPSPTPQRILQRKCACGGISLFGGECSECRKRRITQSASTAGSGFAPKTSNDRQHHGLDVDFSRTDGIAATLQEVADDESAETTVDGSDAGPTEKPSYFVPKDLDVLEACGNFYGESRCIPSNGKYETTKIADPCCSKQCTTAHEEQHVTDLGGPGSCCERLAENIRFQPEQGESLIKRYNEWLDGGATAWSECRAWGVSEQCAQKLVTKNKCAEKPSDCCNQLRVYQDQIRGRKDFYCSIAPKTKPRCPFTFVPGPISSP